jgi:hypothetical protein
MSDKIAAARESLLTEYGLGAQMTQNGVPDGYRGRGKVGFVEGTLQKSTGGQDDFPRAGAQAESDDDQA